MRRGRGRPNLTWEESVKRDLKDWCITKELALYRREWKLAIHMPEPWSSVPSFLLSSVKVFFPSLFAFFLLSVLLSFFLLSNWFLFLSSFVFPILFRHCFIPVSLAHLISSLAYPNLLGTKRLGCCCCCTRPGSHGARGVVVPRLPQETLALLWYCDYPS
jgi:hypothetical protein